MTIPTGTPVQPLSGFYACIKLLLAAVLLSVAPSAAPAQSNGPPRADNQSWNDVQFLFSVRKWMVLNLQPGTRLDDDVTNVQDMRAQATVTFTLNKHLSITPGYLYLHSRPAFGRRGHENRIWIAGTIRWEAGGFTFSDRSQLERRFRFPHSDSYRYRNRLQIEHPVKPWGFKLNLFGSDEVSYDSASGAWSRNRFIIGATRALSKKVSFDLYYVRQNDGRSRPGDLHVVGTAIKIRVM